MVKYSNGSERWESPHGTFKTGRMLPTEHQSNADIAVRTFRLQLAYDGTDYFGWQVQPGRPTIQGTLAEAVRQVTGETVLPQGSGRTDTGVHAQGQVVSCALHANIPADRLLRALNRKLPSAIRVLSASAATPAFHARSGVLDKTYEYRIFERRITEQREERICPPATARFTWDCRWPLNPVPMDAVANQLIGTHDFTSFAASDPDRSSRAAGTGPDNTRTIFHSQWRRSDDGLIYRVTGSGFLHHMVRNIVGTCVLAGAGRFDPASIPTVLQARTRSAAGPTAPPQGLHLVCVTYCSDSAICGPEPSA